MIVCICRGASDRDVTRAIDAGARSIRDLQRCGMGDQCGSCHSMLKAIVARAESTACPVCAPEPVPASVGVAQQIQ